MIDVMHQAEDLENLENLHSLCALVQTIRELLLCRLRRLMTEYIT